MERIAIFGGSFNPPGLHHRAIVGKLRGRFDQVIVVPCGPRPDKQTTNDIEPLHRAVMADLTFSDLGVEVDLSDLENDTFTRTHFLEERFRARGEVWHVVGVDLIAGGKSKESFIHRTWKHGNELWTNLRFAVINPGDPNFDPADLPPQSELIEMPELRGRSTDIRRLIFERDLSFRKMIAPAVADYIERYELYRGLPPRHRTQIVFQPNDEFLPVVDWDNRHAEKIFSELELSAAAINPKAILVIGGDGFMLDAIKKYWRRRLPFIGINAGHHGFLLNELSDSARQKFKNGSEVAFNLFQMPMLHVRFETANHRPARGSCLCFNDVWVERETSQAACLKVSVDGREVLPRMVADGVLVATAAGSTAYARAMGAPPIPADSRRMILVGNNVFKPAWKYALLPISSVVEVVALDVGKRPIRGFADGQNLAGGEMLRCIQVRHSRIAAVELGFFPEYDLAEKISRLQFS